MKRKKKRRRRRRTGECHVLDEFVFISFEDLSFYTYYNLLRKFRYANTLCLQLTYIYHPLCIQLIQVFDNSYILALPRPN